MFIRICSRFLFVSMLCTGLCAGEFSLRGSTDKEVAIYEPGEDMVFTIRVFEEDQPVAGKRLTWTRQGDDGVKEAGEGIAGTEGLTITTRMNTPGFVRLQVKAFEPGEDGEALQGFKGGWGKDKTGNIFFDGGACVDPGKLRAVNEPEDFDAFWTEMKAKLAAVDLEVERKELDSPDPKVKLYAVSVTCAGKMPVTGYLSIPADAAPASLPAVCQFHGYGVSEHKPPSWVNPHVIMFNVNAHGMELGREADYYVQFKQERKNYAFDQEENKNPETAYFHDMSLRVLRALEYVKTLPEWDGKTLQSDGGSQGGLQGLWGAGLDPDVSSCNNWSPWCCDLQGVELGRMKGWRPEYTEALNYYDPVYHARRIQGKVHLIANYGDYTCPPSSVWMVYNEVPHENKSMRVKQGCTHSFAMKPHMAFTYTPEGPKDIELED